MTEWKLLRSTGGTFTSVPLTSLTGSAPSMRSVYVTDDGAVFVLAQREVSVGAGRPTALGAPRSRSRWRLAVALISANEIYGAGGSRPQTALRRFDGVSWSPGPSLAQVTNVRTVFVAGPNLISFGALNAKTFFKNAATAPRRRRLPRALARPRHFEK